MTGGAAAAWQKAQTESIRQGAFARWPNEAMLKVLFGSYLAVREEPRAGQRVLDVGCGVGQNLLPFAARGCDVAGVELTEQMAKEARESLQGRGVKGDFRVGTNRNIPFPDASFDLLLSVNALHYETDEANYLAAIGEFARVLKPAGRIFISTVAPEHEIYRRAEPVGPHQFRIKDYDFRNGEVMFFIDHEKYLASYLGKQFAEIETGRITERLMTRTLDFFLAVARKS